MGRILARNIVFDGLSLPAGTEVVLAYRGATTVTGGPEVDASVLDPHGEVFPGSGSVDFLDGSGWKAMATAIDGARFVQVRISTIANAVHGEAPSLRAVGFAFETP